MSEIASVDRYLIVNADDFGITPGVNRGIIEAHERGIVTSASLMVRYPAATEAVNLAACHPNLSVGLHFDVSEWRYSGGQWQPFYVVIDADDAAAVRRELQAQLALFQRLMERPPSHLDSHQHVHNGEPLRSAMLDAAIELSVPLRHCTARVMYCGDFYGQGGRGEPYAQGIEAAQLQRTIEALPHGWTELGCHPGYTDELDSVYLLEREQEIRALCDPAVRRALDSAGIKLVSFHDFNAAHRPADDAAATAKQA